MLACRTRSASEPFCLVLEAPEAPRDLRLSLLNLRFPAWAALSVAGALLLVWGSGAQAGGSRAHELLAVLVAAALGMVALAWLALDEPFERTPVAWILGLALLLRLIAIQSSPLLEDDHFRYLWDGMRTATALAPYHLAPSAFFGATDLDARWQDILGGINHPDVATIYGPVLQWLFAAAYWVAPGQLAPLQGMLLVVDMGVLGVLARQGVGARWLLAYAVHPLILKDAMASAHPDGLLAGWLLLALGCWRERQGFRLGIVLGLAIGTKVVALLVLPLLLLAPGAIPWRWAWVARVSAALGLVLVALYVPFLMAGGSEAAALRIFGQQWRFNPLLYRLLEWIDPVLGARMVAASLVVVGITWMAWQWRWRARASVTVATHSPPLDTALLLLLIVSPVVNAWYWLWVLPLAVQGGRVAGVAMGAASMLAYLNSSVLSEVGWLHPVTDAEVFTVSWPVATLQLAVGGLALAWDAYRKR